jgi:flagellar motor switch protein FliN/FliY
MKADTPTDQNAAPAASGPPLLSIDAAIFKEVKVSLRARLGETSLSVEELLALKPGAVVTLDTRLNDLVELRLNENLVARGEIVAVDDRYGIRIVEIANIA